MLSFAMVGSVMQTGEAHPLQADNSRFLQMVFLTNGQIGYYWLYQ